MVEDLDNCGSASKLRAGFRKVVEAGLASRQVFKYTLNEAIQGFSIAIRVGTLGALSKGTLDSEGDTVARVMHYE